MNPLASRLSKVQHSVAIDRLDCSIPDFMCNTWHHLKRSQEVPKLHSDDGVTGNSDVLGRFSENPFSSVPSDTLSKSKERLEPSSSGSGAAVDV